MEKKIMKVIIRTEDEEALLKLISERHLDAASKHREKDGKIVAEVYVPFTQIEQLQEPGIEIEIVEDAVQTGLERQKEVSSLDRFTFDQSKPPKGFGKKE